ncbi:MAG: IPT/TIG domain-containing protein [Blastocatellia bacterium]
MPKSFFRSALTICGLLLLLCAFTGSTLAQTKDFVSVDAARYSLVVAPNTIAAGFTVGVTSQTYLADDADANTPGIQLPTSLGGVSVSVNNRLAGLFFVSPNQINYAVPSDTETDGPATVVVTDAAGSVLAQGTLNVARAMLSLFTSNSAGTGAPAALVTADGISYSNVGKPDGSSNVVPAGQYLVLFGTGIRGTVDDIKCFIGGVEAPVAYAGLQGGFLALYQVNVQVPQSLASQGPVEMYLTDGSTVSNTVTIDMGGNPTAPANAPIVTAVSANQVSAGQVVTLTGSNFPTSASEATVRVGASYGRVVSSNATQMSFIVPYGMASGRIAVGNVAGERLSNTTLNVTTSISGTVLGPDGSPLPGLFVSVSTANVSTTTDATGRFLIAGVPSGITRVDIDGSSLQYLSESLSLVVSDNRDNEIGVPVTLLQDVGTDILLGNEPVEATAGDPTTVKTIDHDGLRLTIPGKVTFPNGTSQGRLRLGRIPRESKLPVSLPAGIYPSVIAFIAPPGTTFGDAGQNLASLSFPNVDQLPVGTKLDLYAYDRKAAPSAFVKKGDATVSQAGDKIEANGLIDVATIWFVGLPSDSSLVTRVTGRVLDASDKPVSGARVFVRGRDASTDVNGNFVITSARAKNGDDLNVEVFFFTPTGVPLRAVKTVKAVVPGETSAGDIKLPAEPPLVVLIRPGEAKVENGKSVDLKVVLSRPLSADATINLAKADGVDVTINPASVKIEAGKTEASFSVSGSNAGRAVIAATLATAVDGITADQARGAKAVVYVLPTAPVISSVTPNSGFPGAAFLITGSGFSAEAKYNQIIFKQGERWMMVDPAKVSVVSTPNVGLKGVVPGLKPGEYDVFVLVYREGSPGVASNSVKFTITEAPGPQLTAIDPKEGKPGTQFTLTGSNFHPEAKYNGVFFKVADRVFPVDPSTLKTILSSTPNNEGRFPAIGLTGQIPRMPAGSAEVYVVVFRDSAISATSNKLAFNVLGEAAPKLTAIDPAEGMPRTAFTITGSGFAPDRTLVFFAQGDKKFFLDPKATVVTADSIKGTVPAFPAGLYDVFVVVNNDNVAGTLSNKLTFRMLALTPPVLKSLSPTEGAPGSTFTITGEGFGEYNQVTFKFGDKFLTLEAGLVKPTPNGLVVTVPRIAAGDYQVVVRALQGGASSEPSNALAFKVLPPPAPPAPQLTAIKPAEGQSGAPFAIEGTGFAADAGRNGVFFKAGDKVARADVRVTSAGLEGFVPPLPAGNYEVSVVIFQDNVQSAPSNILSFKVLAPPAPAAPVLESLSPAEGKTGEKFIIKGKGFAPNAAQNRVIFRLGDLNIHVDEDAVTLTDAGLECVVPEVPTADYEVFVVVSQTSAPGVASNKLAFRVNGPVPAASPKLESVTPGEGKPGDSFVIKGSGFAPEAENNMVVFKIGDQMRDVPHSLVKVTADGLAGSVPWMLPGDAEVFVVSVINGSMSLPSNRLAFKVLQTAPPAAPKLEALSPVEGQPGAVFKIKGTGFGPEPWMNYVVFRQGTQGTQWFAVDSKSLKVTADGLEGIVPQVPAGVYDVMVVFHSDEFRSEPSNALQFKVLAAPAPAAPKLTAINPVDGVPGATFTISGQGFANDPLGHAVIFKQNDKVFFADVKTLQLSANGLSGKVPAVAAGDYEVFVALVFNGQMVPSNGLKFTVKAPAN